MCVSTSGPKARYRGRAPLACTHKCRKSCIASEFVLKCTELHVRVWAGVASDEAACEWRHVLSLATAQRRGILPRPQTLNKHFDCEEKIMPMGVRSKGDLVWSTCQQEGATHLNRTCSTWVNKGSLALTIAGAGQSLSSSCQQQLEQTVADNPLP